MQSDLFALPTLPGTPTEGFKSDRLESWGRADSSTTRAAGDSDTARENFLTTLKEITRDHHKTHPAPKSRPQNGSKADKVRSGAEPGPASKIATADGTEPECVDASSPRKDDQNTPQRDMAEALSALLALLRSWGFTPDSTGGLSDNQMTDPGAKTNEGQSAHEGADAVSGIESGLSNRFNAHALKILLAQLQQDGSMASSRISGVLNRFTQMIASILNGSPPAAIEGQSAADADTGRMLEVAGLDRLLREILAGEESRKLGSDAQAGAVGSDRNSSGVRLMGSQAAAGISNTPAKSEFSQSAPDSAATLKSANGENPDAGTATARTSGQDNAAAHPNETGRQEAATINLQRAAGEEISDKAPPRESMTDSAGKQVPADVKNQIQPSAGDASNSNMGNDAQTVKEAQSKIDAGSPQEFSAKVTKIDGGQNDPSLLNAQSQTAEKTSEISASSKEKETESSHESLRTQTMDQIVRRAVFFLRNGQNEARIDLKPEHLGHIRMQITTEHHQVTVRILTEHSFVKDMIENNIQQLKSELQQQGLSVDELEVSVASDSDRYDPAGKHADRLKAKQLKDLNRAAGASAAAMPTAAAASTMAPLRDLVVDYFA